MKLTEKEIGKIAFNKFGLQECDEEYTYFILGYKEAISKQFSLNDVIPTLKDCYYEKRLVKYRGDKYYISTLDEMNDGVKLCELINYESYNILKDIREEEIEIF